MSWQPYSLDKVAQKLVIEAKKRDERRRLANPNNQSDPNSRGESYKMRLTVAYGLERFWGEQLRKDGDERTYWEETWDKLVEVMGEAGIIVPKSTDPEIQAGQLWGDKYLLDSNGLATDRKFSEDDRQVTLAVLLQLCDCLVWWTQRYKREPPREQVTLDTNDE